MRSSINKGWSLAFLLCSLFSVQAFATNPPTNVTANVISSSQINVTWVGQSSNSNIIGYTVASNTTASFANATYHYVSGAGATSLSRTGLNSSTTYYYAVKAEGTSDAYDSAFTSFVSGTTKGGPISTRFYGVNAWMPYQIGPHILYGSLASQWSNVDASGAQIMRYGGHAVDEHADPAWADPGDASKSTLKQYLSMVVDMQTRGIDPVLQVPVFGGKYSPASAADIVRYINITHARGVKYWSIGNEPELAGYPDKSSTAVASYIRSFSSAMKAVDPTIKIIAPDSAWYNEAIINDLTDPAKPTTDVTGKDANGRYYVDLISFHHYNGFDGTQKREDVIPSLTKPYGFNDNLAALNARIAKCNTTHGRTGANALKVAVTEANVNFQNSANDGVAENGAESFLGGQWWAELLGIAMRHNVDFVTFWSVIEGSTIEGNELGFIGADGTTRRPSYYHFQMMAENVHGTVLNTSDNQPLVKIFAAISATEEIAVLIMNQELTTSFNYAVRLDNGTVGGIEPLKINVDGPWTIEYRGTIAPQSTILLVYKENGSPKKKIEYKMNGHANNNLPPTVTVY